MFTRSCNSFRRPQSSSRPVARWNGCSIEKSQKTIWPQTHLSTSLVSSFQLRTSKNFQYFSTTVSMDEGETHISDILKKGLDTEEVRVRDVSGGCGASYNVEVASTKFFGKPLVEQHRMVHDLLHDEMKQMHALSLKTKAIKPPPTN